jgi:thiamine-monophosphate kinase
MTRKGLTEREIIGILKRRFGSDPRLPLGFDDDVAAFQMTPRSQVVLKTDMLVGSTDIPPRMTLGQAARKAVVATVSDFAAKGVQPRGLLVSLGLAPPVSRAIVNEIASGLEKGAREYHCRIIGGDTSETDDLVIDCVGFGFTETGKILRRDGAKPGDIVAVTGDFGKTTAGLRILLGKRRRWPRRFAKLVRSVLHPSARLGTGLKLAHTGFVNSSIDSSDGLAWSLHEIGRLSNVDVLLETIPIARGVEVFAKEERLSAEALALFGGEEYELIVTIQKNKFARVKRVVPSLLRIGVVEKGGGGLRVRYKDRMVSVEPRGYEHFRYP